MILILILIENIKKITQKYSKRNKGIKMSH